MPINEKIPMSEKLMGQILLFLHQIEINDYTTKDNMHDLKMNVYWSAMKSFYDQAIKEGFDPNMTSAE